MGIDYERSAAAFRRGRTLPPDIVAVWGREVAAAAGTAATGAAPDRPRVLDLGCGTGQFLGPLADWLAAAVVVGVEPSPAMRDEARTAVAAAATNARVVLAAGRAERLPISEAAVDVAWLSTVIHQVDDRDAAVRELRRVVRPGGRVLVRGWFGDRPATGLFRHFPGIERSAATFPTTTEIAAAFRRRGFTPLAVTDVLEEWSVEPAQWAARIRELRHADSALRPLTDDEVAAGLAAVERTYAGHPGPITNAVGLTLLVLEA